MSQIVNPSTLAVIAEPEATPVERIDATRLRCRAVLLCAGLGSMEPKPLPAAREWSGIGVVYSVPQLPMLDQRDVLVVGGRDSAVDWANAAQGRASSVSIVHRRHVEVGSDMQTSLPGVCAAGDASEHAGKVRLVSVGFGEAAIAVNHVAASLDPGMQVFPGHSTHHGN